MKIFKMIFNRIFVVGLALILQIVVLIAFMNHFYEAYVPYKVVQIILTIIVFLIIVSKTENPEFKIPWLVLVIAFPILGTPLYLMFASNRMPSKMKKGFRSIYDEVEKLQIDANMDPKIKEISDEYFGDIQYIRNTSFLNPHLHCDTQYFKIGEAFFEDALLELKKAKHFIFLEYFIIDDGDMWNQIHSILLEKVTEGVDVRVMYDDFGSASKIPANFCKKLNAEGIKCCKINPFIPIISSIYNNRNHRKILVIDGKVGYTGGLNIADEYINLTHPYGKWKDNAIKLVGKAVNNLTIMFLQVYNATSKVSDDYMHFINVEEENIDNGIVFPYGDGPKPIYQDQVAENAYLNIINRANKYVYITTPYLICDYVLINALCTAAKRGVKVVLITPMIPDKKLIFMMTRSNYKPLMQAGVKIYQYAPGFIHAKTILSDDVVGMVGTINLDFRSLVHHFENGVWMYKTSALKDIKEDIEKTLEESVLQDEKSIKSNVFTKIVVSIFKLFQVLF